MAPDIRLTAEWVAARHGRDGSSPAMPDAEFDGVSIDTRTLARRRAVRRDSRRAVRRRTTSRRRRSTPGRRASWCRADAAASSRRRGHGRRVVGHRGRRHDGGAAGAGARVRRESGAKVVAITGSAGKTTTKEVTAEFLGDAVPRDAQPGELEQPHRAAAVAHRADGSGRRSR